MGKMTVKWHEDNRNNLRKSVERARIEANNAIARHERLRSDLAHYEAQISEAKKRDMESFDADRLLRKAAVTP